jgi:hypothetical protein
MSRKRSGDRAIVVFILSERLCLLFARRHGKPFAASQNQENPQSRMNLAFRLTRNSDWSG